MVKGKAGSLDVWLIVGLPLLGMLIGAVIGPAALWVLSWLLRGDRDDRL
jgi:hypothetical protein